MDSDIEHLVKTMEQGGIILYPTDTIWGLGCDAHNAQAIDRILQIKGRNTDKGLVLLVDSLDMLRVYVPYVPEKAANLIEYHIRPLTIIYPQVYDIPAIALAPDGSAAIRVCLDPFCKEMIAKLGKAIISTSANLSGQPHPKNFKEINPLIINAVDAVAEHRREDSKEANPSTIVSLDKNGELIFVRK